MHSFATLGKWPATRLIYDASAIQLLQYVSDIPSTWSYRYGYADDLALLYTNKSWEELEKILCTYMCTIADYLSAWKLKLSVTKTTSTAFHLNSKETKRQLAVNGATPCPTTPIQLILESSWIVN